MKKLLTLILACAMITGLFAAGVAAEDKIKVGYDIYFLGNSWSALLYQEFKWNIENNYADKIDVTYVESEGDISKQIANLEDLIAQEVDVIITTPNDTTALNATLQDAMDEGIKVILLCAGIDGDQYDTLITVDETEFGRVGAQWLVEQLNGTGKIICLNGISGLSTSEQRWAGAKSVFDQNPGIEVLAVEDANWDYATGKTVTSDLLAAYPQIDGVWSQGGSMTLGAIEAFQAANRDLVPMTGEDNNGLMKAWSSLGAEGIGCVGTKFIVWRKSEKLEQEKKTAAKPAAAKPAKKRNGNYNPVKVSNTRRKEQLRERKQKQKEYFHEAAVKAAIERRKQQQENG